MTKQTLALIILGTVDWILVRGLRFTRYTNNKTAMELVRKYF